MDFSSFHASESFQWALWSAKKNLPDGQCALGYSYLRGIGVETDARQAAYWLEKAAIQQGKKPIATHREMSGGPMKIKDG